MLCIDHPSWWLPCWRAGPFTILLIDNCSDLWDTSWIFPALTFKITWASKNKFYQQRSMCFGFRWFSITFCKADYFSSISKCHFVLLKSLSLPLILLILLKKGFQTQYLCFPVKHLQVMVKVLPLLCWNYCWTTQLCLEDWYRNPNQYA